jgi:hypothetical protein
LLRIKRSTPPAINFHTVCHPERSEGPLLSLYLNSSTSFSFALLISSIFLISSSVSF